MTQIEQIKAEIEKQRQLIWPRNTGEMSVVDVPKPLEQGWLNALKWMENLINSLPQEPASEELEEAAKTYTDHTLAMTDPEFSKSAYHRDTKMKLSIFNGSDIEVAFIAGANWQEEKDNICYEEIFEDGASWKYEQMMKDAVDADARYICGEGTIFDPQILPDEIEVGQKVKLIIIKED